MIIESKNEAGACVLQSEAWLAAGVSHGFVGVVAEGQGACDYFRVQQKHTDIVLDFRDAAARKEWTRELSSGAGPTADGFILPLQESLEPGKYAVVTADCLPVLLRTSESIACVHAGWRGLASGILLNACRLMEVDKDSALEVLIGPAAGVQEYQVGPEVIEAIGEVAVFVEDALPDKYRLDTAATARKQIQTIVPGATVEVIPVCTISDLRFHSYRREGKGCGRNYSFFEYSVA